MTYEYTGIVEEVYNTRIVGSKGFQLRDIVLGEDVGSNTKYPNHIKFTVKGDKVTTLDGVKKGDRVKATFAVDGRRWDGPKGTQYFTDLVMVNFAILAAAAEQEAAAAYSPDGEEDLPF